MLWAQGGHPGVRECIDYLFSSGTACSSYGSGVRLDSDIGFKLLFHAATGRIEESGNTPHAPGIPHWL